MNLWNNLFQLSLSPLNLLVRAGIVYLWVLLLLRISGKRQIGQMGATEFVAILLISNAVQNSMNGGDNSLAGGLILASILIFLSWGISILTYRYKKMQRIFEGTPTLVIHKGKILTINLQKEHLRRSELITLLRKQGIHSISDVESGILEPDGTITVMKSTDQFGG